MWFFNLAVISTLYKCIYILVLIALKMTAWMDETCLWLLCNKIKLMSQREFFGLFFLISFFASNKWAECGSYQSDFLCHFLSEFHFDTSVTQMKSKFWCRFDGCKCRCLRTLSVGLPYLYHNRPVSIKFSTKLPKKIIFFRNLSLFSQFLSCRQMIRRVEAIGNISTFDCEPDTEWLIISLREVAMVRRV